MLTITSCTTDGIPTVMESDSFSWRSGGDGMGDGYVHEKATGCAIYQMCRMYRDRLGSEPITDQPIIDAVRAFWAEIRAEVEAATVKAKVADYAKAVAEAPTRKYPLDMTKAGQWDALVNEGGEGYNPYR